MSSSTKATPVRQQYLLNTHHELIESEAEEEKQYLLSYGVELEPGTIPG